jgi:hypothetical protein
MPKSTIITHSDNCCEEKAEDACRDTARGPMT